MPEKTSNQPSSELQPLPLLPLRDGVLLPGTIATIPVGRPASVALVNATTIGGLVAVGVQRDASVTDPGLADLHEIAVLARIAKVQRMPRGYQVTLEGLARIQLRELQQTTPYLIATTQGLPERADDDLAARELLDALRTELAEVKENASGVFARAIDSILEEKDPGRLADRVAAAMGLPVAREVHVLLAVDVGARIEEVLKLVVEQRTAGEVRQKIDTEVRKEFQKGQKEAILREQMKAIKRELGDDDKNDVDKLKERLEKADLPEDVRKVADRELSRLQGQASGPEQGVIRNYLEWIVDLPWRVKAEQKATIDDVEKKLNEDHTGLDDVKKRILEQLAVIQMTGTAKATILCLAGPPGVGKTSLGQSVADALGRPFVRVSLGGVRDEAEIRGHRRTYVGAMPGRIVHALKKAGAKNPVFLLDEIDKLGKGWAGDPEAALLEVLDPEQNGTFTDHYMELPFDLSEVLFICTVNDLSQLAPPLRDRLEIIDIEGYTQREKLAIAKDHLIPRKLKEHGLTEDQLIVSDAVLEAIIAGWTREAGVRQLQREITRLCRQVALQVARSTDKKPAALIVDDVDKLKDLIGKQKHFDERAERTTLPGVAVGLAWTPVGGDILFIESSRMPGKGAVTLTGQLGDVMKESATAAMTYVRSNAVELGVDPRFLAESDVHVHIPAGGTPKDGPSAGVTMFTALVSLLTGRKVKADLAMTGEATLRGKVLPVGGIKSKLLAAHRAGITTVLMPAQNARDLDDLPVDVRSKLTIHLVSDMREVLELALEKDVATLGSSGTVPGAAHA
ncbi:MAG: endopeptidase La [Deltaproteobacteria bacterium]|nr:endopeptidase La [Deltaproteobacteria bacterium]